jgi:hypothetical protein
MYPNRKCGANAEFFLKSGQHGVGGYIEGVNLKRRLSTSMGDT